MQSFAQQTMDRDKILDKRLDKIYFYHFGIGMEVATKQNYMIAPKAYLGIGSNRNLINVDLGMKWTCSNPFSLGRSEYIQTYSVPIYLSGSINAIRWEQNAIYVGGEIAYNFAIGSDYHTTKLLMEDNTSSVANSHASWQGKLGCRYKSWDFSVFCENDLSPAVNQKYIYETDFYDYDELRELIFERCRFGLGIAYNIRF